MDNYNSTLNSIVKWFDHSRSTVAELSRRLRSNKLGAAAVSGSVISIFGFSIQKLLQLLSNVVLSHLLFPEAFGLMALATVFLTAISMLSDIGINQAVIQSGKGADENFLNTAWTMSIIRGLLIALIVCAIAWPVSEIYDSQTLFPLLCVLSISSIFQGFSSIAIATQNRDLKFIRVVGIELVTATAAISITILAAIVWKSVWSLALGSVCSSMLKMALSHWILPCHRLRVSIRKDHVSEILKFGKWILFATLVSFIAIQGLPLIQGWLVSLDVLGILSIATALAIAPRELMIKLVNTVAYPVMAQVVRENPENLRGIVKKSRAVTNGAALFLFLTLAAVAQPLINFLYDDRYSEAGLYLSILAINGAIGFLPDLYQSVQLAKGRSHLHFLVMLVMAISRSVGMILGFEVAGVEGMLYGLCIGSFLTYFVSAVIAFRSKIYCFGIDLATILVIVAFTVFRY